LTWKSLSDAATVGGKYPSGTVTSDTVPAAAPDSNLPVAGTSAMLHEAGALTHVNGIADVA
jgi:hypothetical protein